MGLEPTTTGITIGKSRVKLLISKVIYSWLGAVKSS